MFFVLYLQGFTNGKYINCIFKGTLCLGNPYLFNCLEMSNMCLIMLKQLITIDKEHVRCLTTKSNTERAVMYRTRSIIMLTK
jgi:hypothetical protein